MMVMDLYQRKVENEDREVASFMDFAGIQSLMTNEEALVVKNLLDFHDLQFFSKIYVGSKKQPFDMIFDTRSNYSWLMSATCQSCPVDDSKF